MPLSIFKAEERQHSPSVVQVASSSSQEVVDFCYLSNKFFPTEEIIAELGRDLADVVRNYPSMQPEQCELAGALTGYAPEQILVGNGASELIHLVAARLGERWLLPFPSYMEYENVIRDFKKQIHFFPLHEKDNFNVDLEALLREVEMHRIDALVLPNPNSPTGQKISLPDLLKLLERSPRLKTLVIDESFVEFTALERSDIPTLRPFLEQFPQLVIVRSLGKDYGACGLRLGLVATANAGWLDEIRRFLPIWNISPMAEKFLRICLNHREAYEAARVRCIQETQTLVRNLAALPGLKVFETFSNFVLFKILDERITSTELRDHLLKEFGFYVRDCSRKQGLTDKFIRVGTNLPEHNERLVASIAEYVSKP